MTPKFSLVSFVLIALLACGGGDSDTPDVPDTPTDPGTQVDTGSDTGSDTGCTPTCEDKQCGDDGCGGSCGSCTEDTPHCNNGTCSADCTPQCFGQECGDDGCGGSCGECPDGAPYCVKGACSSEQCQPQCLGKDCGEDGCGGTCGECASTNHTCQAGICVDPCGGITYHGCCADETIKWCFDKALHELDCTTNVNSGNLQCGWDPEKLDGVYDCVPEAGDDPSGTHSSTCP